MSILIVSNIDEVQQNLQHYLREEGFDDFIQRSSAQEAFETLGMVEGRPALTDVDLIIIDLKLPDPGGIGACRIIKEQERFRDLPIIVISTEESVSALTAAFSFGAVDYINSPFNPVEIKTRVTSTMRLKQEMDTRKAREHELLEVTNNLAAANRKLRQMAFADGLTGIANRRYFDEFLQKEWRRSARLGQAMALIMIDIDHFKDYNDIYGHQDGDDCLKQVAKTLETTLKRPGDHAVRYGGEEFAVILAENIDDGGVLQVAESLRTNVFALGLEHSGSSTANVVTISVGAALANTGRDSHPEALINAADKALYRAKKKGRNRVEVARLEPESDSV